MSGRITSREGIQWNDDPISEPTDTFVLSCNNHFVDIRSFKDQSEKQFPFDWAFHGEIIKPSDPNGETIYTHDIDSRYIHAIATGSKEDAEKFLEVDSAASEDLPNGDEAERGKMLNPDTLKVERFLELWRPLNSNNAPDKIPLASAGGHGDESVKGLVLVTAENQKFRGKLVRVGSWVQAIVQELGVEGVTSLSILRTVKSGGTWEKLVSWGNSVETIPSSDEQYDQFDHVDSQVVIGGLTWKSLHC